MKLFLKTKDYAVSGEDFQLLHDTETDMLVTQPQPKDAESYYQSSDYISHTDARRNFAEQLYYYVKQINLKRKTNFISKFQGPEKTLLDVGAGTGDFLSAAKKRGWQVIGIEPNRMARGKASEKKLQLKETLEEVEGEKFQLITLWHVLEHLPDLETEISKLVQLLEDDGTLIIAVPNFRSYDAAHYKNFWAGYDVPRHLWHFSKTAIQTLFSKQGMKLIEIRPMIFDAYYVSMLSEKYKGSRIPFISGCYRGLLSNFSAWRTKEYSSLLYVLKKS